MSRLPFYSPEDFEPVAAAAPAGPGHWFIFSGERLLVELGPPDPRASEDPRVGRRPAWARLPAGLPALPPDGLGRTLCIGRLAGTPCYALSVPEESAAPPGLGWEGLRPLFSVLEDRHYALAGRALQLLQWERTHRYCGRCGTPTEPGAAEHVRTCPACKLAAWPRLAPAVMALARRGGSVLLGRSPHFPPGMFSALAGFVEPGESLEQCVRREVAEETGIEVANIRYFASQPWPFPHSLMIAFVCDAANDEIRRQESEIEAAEWFDIFHLPKLPSRISLARRLIDAVTEEMRRTVTDK